MPDFGLQGGDTPHYLPPCTCTCRNKMMMMMSTVQLPKNPSLRAGNKTLFKAPYSCLCLCVSEFLLQVHITHLYTHPPSSIFLIPDAMLPVLNLNLIFQFLHSKCVPVRTTFLFFSSRCLCFPFSLSFIQCLSVSPSIVYFSNFPLNASLSSSILAGSTSLRRSQKNKSEPGQPHNLTREREREKERERSQSQAKRRRERDFKRKKERKRREREAKPGSQRTKERERERRKEKNENEREDSRRKRN